MIILVKKYKKLMDKSNNILEEFNDKFANYLGEDASITTVFMEDEGVNHRIDFETNCNDIIYKRMLLFLKKGDLKKRFDRWMAK